MSTTLATPFGTVAKQADGSYIIRHERHLSHPIARVWRAITEPSQVVKWFAGMEYTTPGQPMTLTFIDGSKGNFKLLQMHPTDLLEYTWSSGLGDAPSVVRFELAEDSDGATRLVLTHSGIAKNVAPHAEGWHQHLDYLTELLDGSLAHLPSFENWPHPNKEHYIQTVANA